MTIKIIFLCQEFRYHILENTALNQQAVTDTDCTIRLGWATGFCTFHQLGSTEPQSLDESPVNAPVFSVTRTSEVMCHQTSPRLQHAVRCKNGFLPGGASFLFNNLL